MGRLGVSVLLAWIWPGGCLAQATAPPGYEAAVRQAKEMQARGDSEGVIRSLEPWAEKPSAEVQHLLGTAHYQRQDYAAAARHLARAMKLEAENSPAWKQTVEALAMTYYFGNRLQDALPLLERASAWNSGDSYFLYALAMAYSYARDWGGARRTFARLFGIPPDSPQALIVTAHFLTRENLVQEAELLIRDAQKKRPDLPDANYRLGLIALTQGRLPEAMDSLKRELALNPAHPMAWHYLGEIQLRMGKPGEAADSLQRAIWLNLRATESYILIASAYVQQQKYGEAEDALKRAVELAPASYEARFQLARLYQKTNRLDLAKQEMAIANKLKAQSGPER